MFIASDDFICPFQSAILIFFTNDLFHFQKIDTLFAFKLKEEDMAWWFRMK